MKQMINTNDYKRLMNFGIKVDCLLCELTGSTCSADHFTPSDKVKEICLKLSADTYNDYSVIPL